MNHKPRIYIGCTIEYGCYNWKVLDLSEEIVTLITVDFYKYLPFDKRGYNNWKSSTLRGYLNTDFLEILKGNGANIDAIIPQQTDLTSLDGLKDYCVWNGNCEDRVGMLTIDSYRKYRNLIGDLTNLWWLITPFSPISNGNGNNVVMVYPRGVIGDIPAQNDSLAVRPVITLKSEYFNYYKPSELKKYSDEDLLEELLKRKKIQETKA